MTTNPPHGDEYNQGAQPGYGQAPGPGYGQGYGPGPGYGQGPGPGYGPVPSYGPGQPQNAALPGLGVRFGARFVDYVIVQVVNIILGFAVLGFGFGWAAVSAILMYAYFVGMDVAVGETLAKKIFKLRVVGPDGGRPDIKNAALRELFMLFNIIPFIGPLLVLAAGITIAVTINSDPRDQGIHDRFAGGTQVLRA